eukprot:UN32365
MEGVCEKKKDKLLAKWKERYLVLDKCYLKYYTNKKERDSKESCFKKFFDLNTLLEIVIKKIKKKSWQKDNMSEIPSNKKCNIFSFSD